jgi:hypothetical protein
MQEIKAKIMFCKINSVCFIDEKGFDADVEDKMPGFAKECRSFSFGVPCKGTSVAQMEDEAFRNPKNIPFNSVFKPKQHKSR